VYQTGLACPLGLQQIRLISILNFFLPIVWKNHNDTGLKSEQCQKTPFPRSGSAFGVNVLYRDDRPGLFLHLGQGGLFHPAVVERLLGTQTKPLTVIWWELSLEAVGVALGCSGPFVSTVAGSAKSPPLFEPVGVEEEDSSSGHTTKLLWIG